jgi:hypothetical protein
MALRDRLGARLRLSHRSDQRVSIALELGEAEQARRARGTSAAGVHTRSRYARKPLGHQRRELALQARNLASQRAPGQRLDVDGAQIP